MQSANMKLENAHLIILGFILYLQNVFCGLRTCGSEFDNVQSRAFLSSVAFEGKAGAIAPSPEGSDRGHTVKFDVIRTFKGKLPTKSIVVGYFGKSKNSECLPVAVTGKKYIVFLNDTSSSIAGESVHRLSAEPVIASGRNVRQVRAMVCNGCAKPPKIRPLISSPKEAKQNKRLTIRCRFSGTPTPNIVWAKDGQILSSSKKYNIRKNSTNVANESIEIINDRKGSRLRIKKVTQADAGTYECQASSVLGWDKREINITVTGEHYELCGSNMRFYCLNGGTCFFSKAIKTEFCLCKPSFAGERCETHSPPNTGKSKENDDKREADRYVTITAIIIGVLVLIALCITAFFMARKRRSEFLQKRKWRQEANFSNANYTKYPLNVQDDCKPYTVSRGVQTDMRLDLLQMDPDRETVL